MITTRASSKTESNDVREVENNRAPQKKDETFLTSVPFPILSDLTQESMANI